MPSPLPWRSRLTRTGLAALLGSLLLFTAAVSMLLPRVAVAATTFVINGRGWGHGIGLSQYGAQGYARDHGWKYQQIVTHYFQGTRVATSPASLTVKVHLDKDADARSSWKIRSGTAGRRLVVTDLDNAANTISLSPDASFWITVYNGNVRVHEDATNTSGTSVPGKVLKTFVGAAYATTGYSYAVQMLGATGPFSTTGLRWRSYIDFNPIGTSTSRAVNRVPMEFYLYGVVPRESPASWATEALKAQAVVARSYAYTSAAQGQTLRCTTLSQVYNGQNGEDSRTNAAVDATKRLVVMYGSDVVKTFFFSSSGGHTANIEDVWVTSQPQPYYKGVDDADERSPYGTSWGADLKLSGTALASEIRSYDNLNGKLDYSVAAPAYVSSVSVERAHSGFVRYVTLRWSNGSVFEIRGTTFQSALSLRSSKFFVTVPAPARYQENDSRIAFSGYWNVGSSSRLLGGKQAWSASNGATCTVKFKGSKLAWIGNVAPTYGKANVFVDGKYNKTVNLYAAATAYRRTLWSVGGLSATTTHTVSIRVLGTKSPSSRGANVAIDAFDVWDGSLVAAPQPTTRVEQTDARLAWAGDWRTGASSYASGGSEKVALMPGSRAVITFVGRGARWIGTLSPTQTQARVSVDGAPFAAVNLQAATTLHQQVLWSKSGLAFGPHTAVIEAGSGSTTDTPAPVPVDAIEIVGGGLHQGALPWLRVEEGSPRIQWSGTWTTGAASVLSGGTDRFTSRPGATTTLAFYGTSVRWIGNRAPSYGAAAVFVDGVRAATVDLYATGARYRQVLFGRSGLKNGLHTLKIQVLAPSRQASLGTVAVDAFDMTGVPATD